MKENIRTAMQSNPCALYSQDGVPETEKRILFTAVHPGSLWTWTAYEADEVEMEDILCFGRVEGFESELGYFSVDELVQNGVLFEINPEWSLQSDQTVV